MHRLGPPAEPVPRPRLAAGARGYVRPVHATLLPPADSLEASFAQGDADALRAAFETHGPLVHSIARRALGPHRADDVTQEVFVGAWRRRDRFDPARGSLAAWLTTMTKHRIIDHVRSERRHDDRRAADHDLDRLGEPTPSAVDRLADKMVVADAIRQLPPRQRRVVTMHYIDGLTHHEIAERFPLPLGTVKSDLRRSLQSLRAHLDTSGG